ncbi:MAG: hypothetical protein Q8L64_03365 [bacterium]|nr:hypothetical protein [bacterium]
MNFSINPEGSSGITNVGELVERGLDEFADLRTRRYEVTGLWPSGYEQLLRRLGVDDLSDYRKYFRRDTRLGLPETTTYMFQWLTLDMSMPVRVLTALLYPGPDLYRAGTLQAALFFLLEYGDTARALLRGGREILFFGDISVPGTCVGRITMRRRRFKLERFNINRMSDAYGDRYLLLERPKRKVCA